MDIVLCENCGEVVTYAMRDMDGTNLEEVYECSNCGHCELYGFADAYIKNGDTIGYHGREGKVIEINKESSIVFFSDTNEEKEIAIEEIVEQN